MTLKQYLIIMILATALCVVALGFVLTNVDPFTDTGLGFSFFYLSIFLAFLGGSSMVSFTLRRYLSKIEVPMFKYVKRSFSDAFITAILLTFLLYLQGKNYLNWWMISVILSIIFLYVIFKVSTKSSLKISND